MVTIKTALEDKKFFNKEEALIRMILLGIAMKMEGQYYCYAGGGFYVSDRYDFKESRDWNPNDASGIPDWTNV